MNLWKELCSRGSPCTMTGHVWPLSTLYVRSLTLSNGHICGGNLGALGSIVEDLLEWIILSYSGYWVICHSHNTLGLLKWKLKRILYSNMKIQSSFNHRHVIHNLYAFISYVENQTNKQKCSEEHSSPNIIGPYWLTLYEQFPPPQMSSFVFLKRKRETHTGLERYQSCVIFPFRLEIILA